jgi:TonB-linked SusC/RagA family outer membrane protein
MSTQRGGQHAAPTHIDDAPKKKLFTFELHNVTLKTALDNISAQTGVELLYGSKVVPINRRVSLVAQQISVTDALKRVLRGTGIDIRVVQDGQILLVKSDSDSTSEASQHTGIIRGTVTDVTTKHGIPHVRIAIKGSRLATVTNDDGHYQITNVPDGPHIVTAQLLGYAAQELPVAVQGPPETLDFTLAHAVTYLTEVVTTGAGDLERYKVGNSIATINADSVVSTQAITSLSDLLRNRAPGAQVMPASGAVGAAKRIRIRGLESISGSNDPILIVDGIRVTTAIGACRADATQGTGATRDCADMTSRLDDIDPDIIESVDVLKGPAASTLYGSDAANGVIVVKTKRGHAGPTRWRLHADRGMSYYGSTEFPTYTRAVGGFAVGGYASCGFDDIATHNCGHIDTVFRSNILTNPALRPWAHGNNTSIGIDASGGYEKLQYFVSGGYDDELGTSKMPTVDQDIIYRAQGTPLGKDVIRPNAQHRISATGRLTGQLGANADFSLGSQLIKRYQRRGTDGLNDMFSFRFNDDTTTLQRGWSEFWWKKDENVTHTTNNVNVTWHGLPWMNLTGTYGFDFAVRDDKDLAPRDACTPFCQYEWYQAGIIRGGRETDVSHTANLGTVLTFPVTSSVTLRTSAGGQYTRLSSSDLHGEQYGLDIGQTDFRRTYDTPDPNAIFKSFLDETTNEQATAGWYIDQSVAFNNRLFVNGALRQDRSSDLGEHGVKPTYPKFGLSWLISQEPFFPWKDLMSLRLRTAYGHAGVSPASTARLRVFDAGTDVRDGQPTNIATIASLGNFFVRPERTVEEEYGFEVATFEDRFRVDYTRYHKFTRDAIVDRELPPSLGVVSGVTATRQENIGNVRNVGTEVSFDARVIDLALVRWNMNLAYASRSNTLVKLGQDIDPFFLGGEQSGSRVVEGYPLFGRWARPILDYGDANGDGMIEKNEIVIGDSMVYLGPSEAKYDMSINQNLSLFHDQFEVAASFQYQHGLVQLNKFMADNVYNLAATNVIGAASLQEQAYAMAALNSKYGSAGNASTLYGFFENTNLLRFNNLSIMYRLPDRLARTLRTHTASVTLVGTNIGLWSNYSGSDPENNSTGAAGNLYVDGGQFPSPKAWTLRLNLTF